MYRFCSNNTLYFSKSFIYYYFPFNSFWYHRLSLFRSKSHPGVAYKSVSYKKKHVMLLWSVSYKRKYVMLFWSVSYKKKHVMLFWSVSYKRKHVMLFWSVSYKRKYVMLFWSVSYKKKHVMLFWSVSYKKACNVVLKCFKHEEITFPHEFIFVFIPYFIWVMSKRE